MPTEVERTLIIVKPDGVQRALTGEILGRFEKRGLKIVGLKLIQIDRPLAERHYAVHEGKPFYAGLIEYISLAPVVVAVLEGPNAILAVRGAVGSTRPHESPPGSIRGDFGVDVARNLIHASDAPETATNEIELYFKPGELVSYGREIDRWIVG
ncbi:MAG TPA: nucleoside-diphosphate kinase [Chloroflexota bacterium]|jgi:nucleoside-diphosphate kinase|nr:nucleoside-diphosphate kinase [Chloroflexota bacterium]